MKKIFTFIVLALSVVSCSKESNPETNTYVETSVKKNTNSFTDGYYGQMHNDILDIYYANYDYSNDDIELMENAVEEYLTTYSSSVSLTDLKQSNPSLYNYSQKLYNTKGNVEKIKLLFQEIHNDGLSTKDAFDYSIQLIQIFEDYEGDITAFNVNLNLFKEKIVKDKSLEINLKEDLLRAVEIAEYSHMYWYEILNINSLNEQNDSTYSTMNKRKRIAVIAGGDVAGALTGIQSGLVNYASLVFGPWGGAAALAGTAAVGSLNAAGILR